MHSTFSLAALDPASGLMGIGIATMVPAAGSICPHIRHGTGAVCTQGWTNPYLAPKVLDAMDSGLSAADSLADALADDPERHLRQVLCVDAKGGAAVHSGDGTNAWSGGIASDGLAIAGNFLVGQETLDMMRTAFQHATTPDEPKDPDLYDASIRLADALIAALCAGEHTGGDWRGNKSAAVLVGGPEIYPLVDLRTDHHDQPIEELRRIFEISRHLWFPFIRAVPTRTNPLGNWADVRDKIQAKDTIT
jgi:uncharacterized Ntn-hydrolase superfamily protein